MPVCTICHEDKPEDAFNRNRSKANGLHSYCRDCSRQRVREAQERLRQDPSYVQLEEDRKKWKVLGVEDPVAEALRRFDTRHHGEDPVADILRRLDARRD